MGYTHYWSMDRKFTDAEWLDIMESAAKIISTARNSYFINLAWEYDTPDRKPQVDMFNLRFNGIGDDGHETFCPVNDATDFDFCKTNRNDYDAPVVAVLIAMKHRVPDFSWRSDGWLAEHADGLKLFNEACESDLEWSNMDAKEEDPDYEKQKEHDK